MKAAIVRAAGELPVYGDFEAPVVSSGEKHIAVTAAALSPLVRARASGTHYSSSGGFPFIAGVDGVGRLEDGSRVYFLLPRAPYGAMAEQTVAPETLCLPLPDGLDDTTAAAIANPGMSSMAALLERAQFKAGETVLVNGATGASGRLAVQIARHLGAGKIIATGRNADTLASLERLGADATIRLTDAPDDLGAKFEEAFSQRVDVVLDYLWGDSAERLLKAGARAAPTSAPVRFVQIGTAGGLDITLPGALLRSSTLELMGSGIGSVSLDRLLASIAHVFEAAATAGLELATSPTPLSELEQAWPRKGEDRVVFTMGS